jgi:hypothetical protein
MEENRDTKGHLKPHFKKKEIVVAMPKQQGFGMAIEECRATVLYVGDNQEHFEVGDDILFDRKMGREISFFEEPLWRIENELSVICKIVLE